MDSEQERACSVEGALVRAEVPAVVYHSYTCGYRAKVPIPKDIVASSGIESALEICRGRADAMHKAATGHAVLELAGPMAME